MNPVAHVLGKCLAVSRSWLSTVYKPEGGQIMALYSLQTRRWSDHGSLQSTNQKVVRSWLSTVYKPEGGSVISAINSQVLAKLGSERAEIRAVLEVSQEKSFGASDLAITHPFDITTEIFEVYWLGFLTLGNDWSK